MNAVTVKRLRLKARQEDSSRAAFFIEDALRTEIVAPDRLVLMRQLLVDRRALSSASHVRSSAVRDAFYSESANGCHASSASAVTANCVWFSNAGEARRMLLTMLVKGVEVKGWFWYLAVPEWKGQSLTDWVGGHVRGILAGSKPAALVELVEDFAALGATQKLARIVANLDGSPVGNMAPENSVSALPLANVEQIIPAPKRLEVVSIERQAAHLLSRFSGAARAVLQSVSQAGLSARPVLEKLCEQLLLAAAPSLSLDMPRLVRLAKEVTAQLAEPAVLRPNPAFPSTPDARQENRYSRSANAEGGRGEEKKKHRPVKDIPTAPPVRQSGEEEAVRKKPVESAGIKPEDFWRRDALLESKAAGLWLVIPSMIRCGWREWLQDRPDVLAEDRGRMLLRLIARHHRVDQLDDALVPFGEPDEISLEPEWARLWRRGINGWLYRKTRFGLHNLIWRPGKIGISEERIDVHFPLADADLRLRLFALDVDPGWTDWLGFSVRYHFGGKVGG